MNIELIIDGKYKEHNYCITESFANCAYIKINEDDIFYNKFDDVDYEVLDTPYEIVNITSASDNSPLFDLGMEVGQWIGWDYGHTGAFNTSLKDILIDIKGVIEQIVKLKET